MSELKAEEAQLQMVVQITRKETGKVEEYVITSIPDPQEPTETKEE